MNEKTDHWDNFFASLPVDTTVREDHRHDLEDRVLDAFDTAAPKNERAASRSTTRRLMQSRVLRLAIAASLLIALAFAFSVGNRPAFALEALVDKIVNVSTARWDMMLQRHGIEDHRVTFSLTPNGYRMESDLQITIVNWETGKGLGLFPQTKNAVVLPVPKQPIAEINQFLKIQDGLREAMLDPEQNVESLGEQTFEKATLTGFRFTSGGQLIDVWANPSTQFPERIEISIADGNKAVLLNYETDIEQEETRLSTIVPDGYRLVPGEDDLISTLRISCELSGGVFPSNLSTEGIGELSFQFLTKPTKSRGTNKENENAIVEELLEFQRGFAYLIMLVSDRKSDVHYAGSGVTFNEVDRPILWYKPKGTEHYRVIDATLAVTDQTNAPDIAGAMHLSLEDLVELIHLNHDCDSDPCGRERTHPTNNQSGRSTLKISRWYLAISTTACVVLFTMGALSMLESQNYIMAGVFLFFAFWVPLQDELDTLFKRRFGIETDTETDPKTGKGVGSEENIR